MISLFSRFPKIQIIGLCFILSSCYVFRKKSSEATVSKSSAGAVLGESLGARASGVNETALADLYAVTTAYAPAAVRPDPDTFVRQLLLQYREPGSVVAREIGRVEQFRSLLGGANVTFSIVPQETYDATSLLAELKVAEELCTSLVNPNSWEHPGWATILPAGVDDSDSNLRFLYKRLVGTPVVDEASITTLTEILNSAKVDGAITEASYVPVCATLIIDAEALLL